MKLDQAQQLVHDLLAAGYSAWATQQGEGEWQVSSQVPNYVAEKDASNFAGGHGVTMQSYGVSTAVVFI